MRQLFHADEHLLIMQSMQKQRDVIRQIEARLLKDSATTEDLSRAIRILKNDHRILTTLQGFALLACESL